MTVEMNKDRNASRTRKPGGNTTDLFARLFTIHDLLPYRKGVRGMGAARIQRHLEGEGFQVDIRTVQRDMRLMEELFFVEASTGAGKEQLWKRHYPENLCSRLRPGAGRS